MKLKSVVVYTLILAVLVCARLSALDLSVTTNSGTLFGVANEFVYDQSVSDNYVVSELNWIFQPIYYYGVDIHVNAPNGFFVMLSLNSGINARSGTMEDSDYLNGDGKKTLYSQSDNYTEQAFFAELRVGGDLSVSREFDVIPFASFHYMDLKWSARDGYLQYPQQTGTQYYVDAYGNLHYGTEPYWSADVTKTPLYGVGVIYQQQIFIPAVGFAVAYKPTKALSISASIAFSPFAFADTVDNHVLRLVNITDSLHAGVYVEPEIDIAYLFSDRMSVHLAGTYKLITGLVGDSTWAQEGTTSTAPSSQYIAGPESNTTVKQGGGASFQALGINLSLQLSL